MDNNALLFSIQIKMWLIRENEKKTFVENSTKLWALLIKKQMLSLL